MLEVRGQRSGSAVGAGKEFSVFLKDTPAGWMLANAAVFEL